MASDGKVSEVKILKGHPLLVGVVEDVVKRWTFVGGSERRFELTCDFDLHFEPLATARKRSVVLEPFHLRIVAVPYVVEIYTATIRKN